MLTQHIALVPEADGVDASELARVSAALQKQVTRDLSPVWGIAATVDAFPYLEDVPVGYWPIILGLGDLGSQAGIHVDRNGQPYALVQMGKGWSLAASRACLEMLVNPFENRTISAPSLRSDQAPVEFLIEVCGPCEDGRHAYSVNGVVVSDFCTPAFFGAKDGGSSERFSWSGAITTPLRVTPGGHVTWFEPITGSWWLRSHWGENPVDTQIGPVDRKLFSVRELVQACGLLRVAPKTSPHEAFEGRAAQARQASVVKAQRLRSLLGSRGAELDSAIDSILAPRATDTVRVTPARYGVSTQEREPVRANSAFDRAVVETKPSTSVAPEDDDVEVVLELDGDEDYDFEYDEPTLPNAPAHAVEQKPAPAPAPEQTVRVAGERQSPPPFPSPPSGIRTAPGLGGGAYIGGSAPGLGGSASVRDSSPVRTPVPSAPAPTTLAPISMPSMPEAAIYRGRSQFVGGAIGVAGLLALLWAGRGSLSGSSSPQRPSAPRAALSAAPVEPPPVAAAPAVVAQPSAPAPAAKVVQVEPARSAASAAHAPLASRPRHRAESVALPPPAPASQSTASAHDTIADLIDTRR